MEGGRGHSVAGLGYGWAGVDIEVFWRIPAILCEIRVFVHLSGFEGKSDEMQEINGKGVKEGVEKNFHGNQPLETFKLHMRKFLLTSSNRINSKHRCHEDNCVQDLGNCFKLALTLA